MSRVQRVLVFSSEALRLFLNDALRSVSGKEVVRSVSADPVRTQLIQCARAPVCSLQRQKKRDEKEKSEKIKKSRNDPPPYIASRKLTLKRSRKF